MLPRAALLFVLTSACACAPSWTTAPVHVAVVPCAEPAASGDTTVTGRQIALVGDTLVVAAEASGAFLLDGKPRRCPAARGVLVLGLDRAGATRFAWCVASPAPFPRLAVTLDGFAIAGRTSRDARVEPPVDASAAPTPSERAEEVAVLRFSASGAYRDRTKIHTGPGSVGALAALPDGSLLIEGTAVHLPPERLFVEHFLVRADDAGGLVELLPRQEQADPGSPPVELVPRPFGGAFRVTVDGSAIVVESVSERGERAPRARIWTGGAVVDLAAAPAAADELWLAWSVRLGRGEPARFQRLLARIGATGAVNERGLGREDLNVRIHGVVPLGPDRAAVLFQVWKARGERARFAALELDARAEISAAALVAFDVPGTEEVTLAATGDDAVGLGISGARGEALLTGWFRGPLRAGAPVAPAPQHRCGMFVETVGIAGAR